MCLLFQSKRQTDRQTDRDVETMTARLTQLNSRPNGGVLSGTLQRCNASVINRKMDRLACLHISTGDLYNDQIRCIHVL